MTDGADLHLHVADHATGQAVLTVGVPAQLDLSLRNSGDAAGTLRSAAGRASTLSLFMPSFCTRPDPKDVHAEGWTAAVAGAHLLLTYAGPDGAAWAPGSAVTISVANVV